MSLTAIHPVGCYALSVPKTLKVRRLEFEDGDR
jgi:hypothetical protein